MLKPALVLSLFFLFNAAVGQEKEITDVKELKQRLGQLRTTELVMSMSQRSLIMPGYLTELKALIAKQAYNFWMSSEEESYVSHLNVYSALHQANKYLGYDSLYRLAYHEVGRHSDIVTSVQFGSDKNSYFTSSSDGTILKWNLLDPRAIPEVVFESDNIVRSIDISDDGEWLMAVFFQTGVALVSLSEHSRGEMVSVEDPEPVQTAVFMPNEQKYLSVTSDGNLKVKGFQTATKKVGRTESIVMSLEVDENDGTIYAGTLDGVLESWKEQTYFGYHLGSIAINCLDISSDGRLLAVGREKGDAILWSIEEKKLERLINGHQSAITDIEFSPDDRRLLTTSRDKTARIWDLGDSRKLPIIIDDHRDWVMTGCFDPSGRQIITGSRDHMVRTWSSEPHYLATRLCIYLDRDMTQEEWKEFVGTDIPYQRTCQSDD